jgi:MFS family permease
MSVCPVYQSEIARAAQRGWQVCCQQTIMLVGLMLAYWINYGMYFHDSATQWRFPLLFQLVFGAYILVLTPFLPDTPRWLMRHDSHERATHVLSKLRNKPVTDRSVVVEADAIKEVIEIEAREEGGWKDLFRSNGINAHKRFYLSLGSQFMQQLSTSL